MTKENRTAKINFAAAAIGLQLTLISLNPSSAAGGLQGHYVPATGVHPFMFASASQVDLLLNSRNLTVHAALTAFATTAQMELKTASLLEEASSGCNLRSYLKRFEYENGSASRVAADLAFYWFLNSRNRGFGDKKIASPALETAKRILLSWARVGFREQGKFLDEPKQYCGGPNQEKTDVSSDVGLQIGRGIPYLVQAYDNLLASHTLSAVEKNEIDIFLSGLYRLESRAMNERAASQHLECNRYSNHVTVQIAALLTLARFRGDGRAVTELANEAAPDFAISWTSEIQKAIYGAGQPVLSCYKNGQSPDFAQTPIAAAGEIIDRYRAGEGQTFGYTMFSLDHLLIAAQILAASGFCPYTFQTESGKSILSALHYYSYYYSNYLSEERVSLPEDNNNPYPNFQQYVGKTVSQGALTISGEDRLLLPFLRGWNVFRHDAKVTLVIKKAIEIDPLKAFSRLDSLGIPALLPFAQP